MSASVSLKGGSWLRRYTWLRKSSGSMGGTVTCRRHRHAAFIVQLRLLTASESVPEVHACTHNSQMSILLYVLTPLAVADVVGSFAPRLPHQVVDALRQRVVDEAGAEHAQIAGHAHQPL